MGVDPKRSGPALLAGMRGLRTCDSSDVVAGIVRFVVSQHQILGWFTRTVQPQGRLALVMILFNGLRCFLGVYARGRGDVLVAARRPNERRATDDLKRMTPEGEWTELVFRWRIASMVRALATLAPAWKHDCRRTARFAGRLIRRHGVFNAMRSVELLAYYRRYTQVLATRPFRMAVMSSHSNPHGIALNLAARRFGVPIVLITHGMPIRPIARLDYTVAIVECDVSRQVYENAGCLIDQVIVKSRSRDHAPMHPLAGGGLTVGVFLSKDPVEARVMSSVRALLADGRVRRILVRPHPVNLWRQLSRTMLSLRDDRVSVRSGGLLADDLRDCDLVLAGNSTVLLDAVVAGRPACYVRGFDHGPYDVQDFVKFGLVCEIVPERALDCRAIAAFYARSGWPAVLRLFADVDHSDSYVATSIRSAVKTLVPAAAGVACGGTR